MRLEGKAKDNFEFWWQQKPKEERGYLYKGSCETFDFGFGLDHFYRCSDSMQYGVFVDWFDSVGVYVDDEHNEINRKFHYNISLKPITDDIGSKSIYNTRPEARTAAIEKQTKSTTTLTSKTPIY